MGIISEFREFAVKGNMIDMAVGLIMGAAFGTVITSLVNDVIMPPIGAMMNGVDFSSLSLALPSLDPAKPATLNYGKFINAVISFLITAWAIFMLVKAVNKAKTMAEKPKAPAAPPAPPRSEMLLEEIRNALVKR